MERGVAGTDQTQPDKPEIRFLVESALRIVSMQKSTAQPQTRQEWVDHLTEALMSYTDAPHQAIVASMMSRGITSEDILQTYVPASAKKLGDMWEHDRASFVDVTVGGARLQQLFRNNADRTPGRWPGRSVPQGPSMLMVTPDFEDHSLGAFVAADSLRRHGVWVHMCISLAPEELVSTIKDSCHSVIGLSLATLEAAEKAAQLIKYLRSSLDHVPPIVVGGRAVEIVEDVEDMTGADFAIHSTRDVIEKCGLASVSSPAGVQDIDD